MNIGDRERFGNIIASARISAGVSQEELAKRIGKGRRTIQSWESGLSCPNILDVFDYFDALSINPEPYIKEFKYGNVLKDVDYMKREDTMAQIESLSHQELEIIHFLFTAKHGHSPLAYLQKIIADLQCPLGNCYATANMILANYKVAKAMGLLNVPDAVQPDLKILEEAIEKGKDAFINNLNSYS